MQTKEPMSKSKRW